METKDLNKLKRKELLELILAQASRIEKLEKELNSRRIKIEESGSLAEAVLKLNNLFEDAQKAIDDYTYNIKLNNRKKGSIKNNKRGNK